LVLAGFGVIAILLFCILRILIPWLFPKLFEPEKWNFSKEITLHFNFLVVNSVAFVFFARYVGKIRISFLTAIIIIIISMAAAAILLIINEFRHLKSQIPKQPNKENFVIDADSTTENDVEIEFESENKSEYFSLFVEQIILIKSANNYIEVIYKHKDKISRKLIRNTLKNAEELFSKYPSLIRCHRSFIVNKNYIQKLIKGSEGLKLLLFDYPQEIHVSRQYALQIKQALKEIN
jgi:DNA-binding LytR/AlgR family response regulator